MREPGVDEHEWAARWEDLQGELETDPAATLPEVGRLVDEILEESDYQPDVDPEIDRELETAREVTERLDAGATVDPGDVGAAIAAYRTVYEQFVTDRRA